MHRVVLIEDDPMVLEVNRQFVERVPGFEIVGTSSNGIEGIKKVRHLKPDLVILDIYMPGQMEPNCCSRFEMNSYIQMPL